MTDSEFRRARQGFLRQGEISRDLLVLLRRVVKRLVLFGGLPPMYSPTGQWDFDAEEEMFADWLSERLLGTGQLAALLHSASRPGAFSRLAELYLRRHLINRLERSYASNLYGRLRELLPAETQQFAVLVPSGHEHDVVWTLAGSMDAAPWQGSEDELVSLAWGLGEFETIRYREDAKKLSPVLEHDELVRFVSELLTATGGQGLTLSQLVRVLVRRFDLEPVTQESLDLTENEPSVPDTVIDDLDAAELARAVLAELTSRGVDVLREWLRGLSVREIGDALELSAGTVSNEQATIRAVLGRMSDPDGKSHSNLLNALRDLLFIS
jgi:DNA-binding CsgD family transcriptional regulator